MLPLAAALIVGTLVSEDAACLAAGALVARGDLSPLAAIAACAFGIFAGDMALWAVGRSGSGLLRTRWFATRLPAARLERARAWLVRHSGRAILLSRFTPGSRLPMYVCAGLLRISPWRFGAWTLCASLLWTPVIVMAAAGAAGAVAFITPAVPAMAAVSLVLVRLVVRPPRPVSGA